MLCKTLSVSTIKANTERSIIISLVYCLVEVKSNQILIIMKMFIVFAAVIAAALAAGVPSASSDKETSVLNYARNVGVDGYNYKWVTNLLWIGFIIQLLCFYIKKKRYETSDGTSRMEEGSLKNVDGLNDPALTVHGSVKWTAPDGKEYTLRYTADESGYHPEADHLPK